MHTYKYIHMHVHRNVCTNFASHIYTYNHMHTNPTHTCLCLYMFYVFTYKYPHRRDSYLGFLFLSSYTMPLHVWFSN